MKNTVHIVIVIICLLELTVAQVNREELKKLVAQKRYANNPIALAPNEFAEVMKSLVFASEYSPKQQSGINELAKKHKQKVTEEMLAYHVEAVGYAMGKGYFDGSMLTVKPNDQTLVPQLEIYFQAKGYCGRRVSFDQFQRFVKAVFEQEVSDNKNRIEIWYNTIEAVYYGEVTTEYVGYLCRNVANLMKATYVQKKD